MRFPLDQKVVGGFDYGQDAGYTPHHLGCDWVAKNAPLYAPCDGTVAACYYGVEGGNTMLFRPKGKIVVIRWLHLSKFIIKSGPVTEDTQLAVTGNTGMSEGAHLHEDIWPHGIVTLKFGDTMDPKAFYAPPVTAGPPPPFQHQFKSGMLEGTVSSEVAFLHQALIDQKLMVDPGEVVQRRYGYSTCGAVLAFQKRFKVASDLELEDLGGRSCGPKTVKELNLLYAPKI